MIFRIYPTKDTWISNDFRAPNYTRLTGANVGGSEELDVFKRSGMSGAIGSLGSSSLGRALLQFDFSRFSALTASGDLPSTGLTFTLRMNHKTSACGTPSSYDLVVAPVSSSWDEGLGRDVDLGDKGFANWVKRTSTAYWSSPGGDFLSSPRASAHLDTGREDLELDVTPIVNQWLSGNIPNNGLGVMLTSSIESDAVYVDYYQKKFYSRQTDFEDRAPYIEVRANDFVGDDRSNLQWGRSGTLYLYNVIGGTFTNLPGNFVIATISDASGVLMQLTASRGVAPGIYSASFALPTGTFSAGRPYSGSVFYDSWGSGSFAFGSGSFSLRSSGVTTELGNLTLVARVKGLQDEFCPEDVPQFNVSFRTKPHTLAVVQTASLDLVPYIVENAFYAIENDSTRERVIPFGTGSQKHTRLSYDADGNSFRLFMSNLHAGNAYRILLLVTDRGRQQVIDGGFKFKVV